MADFDKHSAGYDTCNQYALRLVLSLASRFPAVEGFQALPDLYGKLSQIDNMTCKLPEGFGGDDLQREYAIVVERWKIYETQSEARIRDLETRIEAVHNARLEWAMLCPCPCDHCDQFYEIVRDTLGDTPASDRGTEHGD